MKRTLLAVLLICYSIASHAQFFGKKVDSVACNNGWVIKVGDVLQTGVASNGSRFSYIKSNPIWNGSNNGLHVNHAGTKLNVTQIRLVKEPGGDTRTDIIVKGPTGFNYMVNIEPAIISGEILPPAGYSKDPVTTSSVADEILKFKKLLDAGAITEDEYNEQKRKLLSR